jgi:hypothetical protein
LYGDQDQLRGGNTVKDNDLIAFFSSQLEAAMAMSGWGYLVIQNNQPTQQGIPTQPIVFFEKLSDHQYGWAESRYTLNSSPPPGDALPDFSNSELQWVESTFQVTSFVIQDVKDLSLPTPSDVLHYTKLYLNARRTIATFMKNGVSILRVTDIRNPKFQDDRGLFEANPNFDVVLQHRRVIDFSVPGSDTVIGDVIGVEAGV